MNWNDIQSQWPELKARIRAEHPEVETDELEKTTEGRRQLLQLIEAKYGVSAPVAEKPVDKMLGDKTDGEED